MAWRGEVAWVRISDKVKAAFTDASVALATGESPASRLTAPPAGDYGQSMPGHLIHSGQTSAPHSSMVADHTANRRYHSGDSATRPRNRKLTDHVHPNEPP